MRLPLFASLLAVSASSSFCACGRAVSQIDLKPHVIEGSGPNWLFVLDQRRHIDVGAHEAHLISQWLVTHKADWKPASIQDFVSTKTQLLTSKCGIEIDGDRILLSCETDQKDPDSTIYIKRSLSPDEQAFWNQIIARIDPPNQSLAASGIVSRPPPDVTRLVVHAPRPEYPADAIQHHAMGTGVFLLRVQIKSGRVTQVIVGVSTGSRSLDASAVKAMLQWQFRPGWVPYRKITSVRMTPPQTEEETLVKVPVTFTLTNA